MKIVVNVFRNGETVQIIASAKDSEPGFSGKTFSYKNRTIKFHHDRIWKALRDGQMPSHCDDDYFVEFEVEKPFQSFCEQLEASEFNDPQKHGITHNCAHAAYYALKVAGIELNLPGFIRLNRCNASSFVRLPVLTPYELFLAAKKHKIELLQKNNITHRIAIAKSSLQFFKKKSCSARVIQDVNTIILTLEERFNNNPHHAEFYLRALIHTNDRVIQLINGAQQEESEYRQSSHFFQKRSLGHNQRIVDKILLFSLVTAASCRFIHSRIVTPLLGSLDITPQMLVGTSIGGAYCFFLGALYLATQAYCGESAIEEKTRNSIKNETPLSKAMLDLLQEQESNLRSTRLR